MSAYDGSCKMRISKSENFRTGIGISYQARMKFETWNARVDLIACCFENEIAIKTKHYCVRERARQPGQEI